MTITDAGPALDAVDEIVEPTPDATTSTGPDAGARPGLGPPDEEPRAAGLARPVIAAALATAGAGFVAGGIFGSWPARLLGVGAAVFGAASVLLALRSRHTTAIVAGFPAIVALAGAATLLPTGEGPGQALLLVRHAITAGHLLRPPVPFDPGWRPILVVLIGSLGFASAWIATALERPKLAIVLPLPAVGLTAITQPAGGQFIAGAAAFLLLLAALATLYGGDLRSARQLGSAFEAKRVVKALLAGVPLIVLLVGFNSASFLFPKPVYDPTTKPQKPRAVSGSADQVLFEVKTDSAFTGPWRTGVLDVYDSNSWKLPPVSDSRQRTVTSGATIDPGQPAGPGTGSTTATGTATATVDIAVHDLGTTSVLPSLAGIAALDTTRSGVVFDTRTQLLRMRSGRVPAGITYTMHVEPYPTDAALAAARPSSGGPFTDQLAVPSPPAYVRSLLDQGPATPWAKLNFLRHQLLDNVTAKGAGVPVDISPARVDDLLHGSKQGTPFEIVAAEAMLARWAGVPSRIGFGFDGVNAEPTGVVSVRPRNAAQWLEVSFDGIGWTPLVGTPKKADTSLDNDKNVRVNPAVLPSDDVAVQVYVPYEPATVTQLYQRVRGALAVASPVIVTLLLMYLVWPGLAKVRRRGKRRKWAAGLGPQAQVAVEYAEFRDLATDLNAGDPYATPLEYLFQVRSDDEHAEFAWLVARVLYGDLADSAGAGEVTAAEELGASLRRRLRHGQPVQSQVLATLSRASIQTPFAPELPNIRVLRLPALRPGSVVARMRRRTRARRRPLLLPGSEGKAMS